MTTTPPSAPELFPQLTPPPGGLARLRDRLDGAPQRRPARWRLAVGAAGGVAVAVAVLVIVIVARVGDVGGAGVEVFGVAEGVGSARVEVGGQALSMQPLSWSTLLVWLPPGS